MSSALPGGIHSPLCQRDSHAFEEHPNLVPRLQSAACSPQMQLSQKLTRNTEEESSLNKFMTSSPPITFPISLSFQGKTVLLDGLSPETTALELLNRTRDALGLSNETVLKILYQGKQLVNSSDNNHHTNTSTDPIQPVFPESIYSSTNTNNKKKKIPKLMVLATSKVVLANLATQRSDPTIRGFADPDPDQIRKNGRNNPIWGHHYQDPNYKICRIQPCKSDPILSLGTASATATTTTTTKVGASSTHHFHATQLLEKLSTDPGIVAVLQERELVVGCLGEMDPLDDVVEKKMKSQAGGAASCLLGYNTNAGMRIDIKLRTDDLTGFRPYSQLAETLLHEISHNWVSEHNLLFWTNYGQMRAEYLTKHRALQSTIVNGRTTAELAGLNQQALQDIPTSILSELVREMAQHGLHPRAIEAPIRQRCQELELLYLQGHALGGDATASDNGNSALSPKERALAAAEARRQATQRTTSSPQAPDDAKKDHSTSS